MRRLARSLMAKIAGALVVLAVIAAFARTHRRFFFCEAMGVLLEDPCAAAAPAEKSVAVLPAHHDCCEVVVLPALPAAAASGASAVLPPAPLLGRAPALAPAAPRVPLRARASAASRGPPFAAERQARLMVFLT